MRSRLYNAATDGLWRNNPALVQLLGICPLLAVTTTLVNGLALGLATTFVIVATNGLVALSRRWIARAVRILVFVLIIASFVTIVDQLTNAFFHDLHETIGLFIPLIVTNCAILAQAETVASRRPVGASMITGFGIGIGFTTALVALGALRELAGYGTLFDGIEQLFGDSASGLTIDLPGAGLLVAALPPGAFFGLAALVALKNVVDARRRDHSSMIEPKGDTAR
jgi:electron transport complex protein RnfE